jgi:hypothetical protein
MYTRIWLVIKDEKTRTFEVVNQASNDNAFTNKTVAMQRDGMHISSMVLPVAHKYPGKDSIKLTGYIREDGLYDRLLKEHQAIAMKHSDFWDDQA